MSRTPGSGIPLVLLVAALLASCGAAEPDTQAVAVQAIERGPGKVKPLSDVLALARRVSAGTVIDVELESDVGIDDVRREPRWVYEVEILNEHNHVVELEIDAQTGKLLEVDGAPWPADIPQDPP
jgi:uncharacterized membrane protein YkoI